ncbi:MAG: hypothetical protein HY778_09770 [Betaproteobacteria bacterium]|nr:hypothetical protein [Betaproteobacteria bacterium]
MNDSASNIDQRPLRWALTAIGVLLALWLAFHFIGEQRYYNTAAWQSWRPIMLRSEPQTAKPVEVRDQWRNALTVVQTEIGLYFLSGTRHVPAAGTSVVVEANDHWELYLCATEGQRCMAIHSFCAGAVWPNVIRDANGRAEGCYAPYLGKRSAEDLRKPPPSPEPRRVGPGKRFAQIPPPAGVSHPREWAALMGLRVPAEQTSPGKP